MSIKTKISVVTPVYNAEDTIIHALNSIVNQTFPVFEIILVNDGSKDDSENIIRSFQKDHPEVTIHYIYQENQGPSVARNKGIKMAKGEFIALLDSDDSWLDDKLEHQMTVFNENPDISLLGGKRTGHLDKNYQQGKFIRVNLNMLIKSNRFDTSSTIIKRSIFKEVGFFNENQKYSEDYNLWLRIISTHQGGFLNQVVFDYDGNADVNENGLSGNLLEMEKGELRNFKELYKNNHISFIKWIFISFFSLLKYCRRVVKNKI